MVAMLFVNGEKKIERNRDISFFFLSLSAVIVVVCASMPNEDGILIKYCYVKLSVLSLIKAKTAGESDRFSLYK